MRVIDDLRAKRCLRCERTKPMASQLRMVIGSMEIIALAMLGLTFLLRVTQSHVLQLEVGHVLNDDVQAAM